MAAHVAQVSQTTISSLSILLGHQVHRVYAPCLDVSGAHFASPSYSIVVSDCVADAWTHRFLNFNAVWSETPRFLNDYWELQVSDDQAPEGISVSAENAMLSPCSISFYENGSSAVTSIQIYTLSVPDLEDTGESVVYDKVIQFKRDNGSSFCIFCQLDGPGIATDVRLSEDPDLIQSLLKSCALRLTLT